MSAVETLLISILELNLVILSLTFTVFVDDPAPKPVGSGVLGAGTSIRAPGNGRASLSYEYRTKLGVKKEKDRAQCSNSLSSYVMIEMIK